MKRIGFFRGAVKPSAVFLFCLGLVFLFPGCIDKQYPGMKVRDRYLYTKNNEKVILRGINRMFVWRDFDGSSIPEMEKTGANSIRIVWLTDSDLDQLDLIITKCREADMIPMVEVHDATGRFQDLPKCVDFWVSKEVLALIEKHQEYLLVNIGNEIGDNNVTAEQFEKEYTTAILRMREAGIHVPLIIDGVDWGKSIDILQEKGFDLIAADPDHNLMLSVHCWWPIVWGYDEARVRRELQESAAMGLPLIVGEFGNKWQYKIEEGAIPYLAIIDECQKLEIGWYAWSWGPGNNPQTWLNMTRDGLFESLKGWGKEVAVSDKNSIQNTSLKPASFGGTVKKEMLPPEDAWRLNKDKFDSQR